MSQIRSRLLRRTAVALILACPFIVPLTPPAAAQYPLVERVSVATDGTQADKESRNAAVSADGRYIVFESYATNLVPGDSNGEWDIFLRDRQLGTTTRISLASDGSQLNKPSSEPSISGDGRRIVFRSYWGVLPDVNTFTINCYLFDRSGGTPIYSLLDVRHNGAGPTSTCYSPTIDRAGTRVAFVSTDSLLLPPGTDTNGKDDVFVRELPGGTIRRVNLGPAGAQGDDHSSRSRISANGNHVIYASVASNLVAGDSNGKRDIFLSDLNGNTHRVSLGSGGLQTDGDSELATAVSGDGRRVAFSAKSSNLPNWRADAKSVLYARTPACDRTVAMSGAASRANQAGEEADYSANGRWLVFWSNTPEGASDDADHGGVYVRDLRHDTIELVSRTPGGSPSAIGNHRNIRITADGRGIVWHSFGTDLVPGDTNNAWDVFYVDNPLWDDDLFFDDFDCALSVFD